MEQGPSGLNPELRTPPLPATHVRAGTGHRVLARNYTTDNVGPPTCEFTRDVRPRVATSSGSSPPPTWPNSWTDSTDTNKPRHPRAPNPRPPDPRWTYKPDHLAGVRLADVMTEDPADGGHDGPDRCGCRPPGRVREACETDHGHEGDQRR